MGVSCGNFNNDSQSNFQTRMELSVEYWLTLALTTIPEYSGKLDPVLKFVLVRKALVAVALQVCSVGNIVGWAHVIPEIATSS